MPKESLKLVPFSLVPGSFLKDKYLHCEKLFQELLVIGQWRETQCENVSFVVTMALGITENKFNYKNTNFAGHQRRTQEIQKAQKYKVSSKQPHLTAQLCDVHSCHHKAYRSMLPDTKTTENYFQKLSERRNTDNWGVMRIFISQNLLFS